MLQIIKYPFYLIGLIIGYLIKAVMFIASGISKGVKEILE